MYYKKQVSGRAVVVVGRKSAPLCPRSVHRDLCHMKVLVTGLELIWLARRVVVSSNSTFYTEGRQQKPRGWAYHIRNLF
jgi:hypothetical protein